MRKWLCRMDGPAGKAVKLSLIDDWCGRILPLWVVASLGKRAWKA